MCPSRGSLNFFEDAFLEGAAMAMLAARSANAKTNLIQTNLQIFLSGNFFYFVKVEVLQVAY